MNDIKYTHTLVVCVCGGVYGFYDIETAPEPLFVSLHTVFINILICGKFPRYLFI